MAQETNQSDQREYTIKLIPHQDGSVRTFRAPINLIKGVGVVICMAMLLFTGAFINIYHTKDLSERDKAELRQLRRTNGEQQRQIDQLAQKTAKLQNDMNQLNQLEAEIRKLVNSNDSGDVSRSGIAREMVARSAGQRGPTVKAGLADLNVILTDLEAAGAARRQSLSGLRDALAAKKARLAATPSIWPTRGEVTSRFGFRWGGAWHPGIDIANDPGTPIVATADGYVTASGWNSGGYGMMVEIDHGNGIVTIYGHNSRVAVAAGAHVKKGQVIAYMGSTGYSTGPHCHYEVRVDGQAVDPSKFL